MSNTYARVRRHPWSLLAVVAIGLATLLVVSNIFANDLTQNGTLELDGNTKDNSGAGAPVDWEQVCHNVPANSTTNDSLAVTSPPPANIAVSTCDGDWVNPDKTYFASNKDIEDTTAWGCVTINNPTPKDEILNSYAAEGTVAGGAHAGDTAAYVGFERGTNNGTSFQGVWFLKNKVGCVGPATGQTPFSGGPHASWTFDATGHVAQTCNAAGVPGLGTSACTGDLLLLINFTGGGSHTTVAAFAWDPAQSDTNGVLVTLDGVHAAAFNVQGSDCQVSANAGTDVCATTNDPSIQLNGTAEGCINTPWPPANQASCITGGHGGNSPVIDSFQFFEGFINLKDIFGTVPCFSQALFEARSSAQPTATLKDFTLGSFSTCGKIIIHKETDPEDANQTFSYTDTGGLTPASFNLKDDGNNELGCDYNASTPATTDDCGALGTRVFNDVAPGAYTVNESDPTTLTPPFDFKSLTCQVNSGTASVTPLSSTSNRTATITIGTLGVVECLYENRQRGSIIVRKNDAHGALLPGAGYTFDVNPFTGAATPIEILDGGASDQFDGNDGLLCIDNVIFGTYNLTETTVPAGYFGDTSIKPVTVNTSSTCAGRTASATPDATFVNTLGTILIHKVSAKGNTDLGGACFSITGPSPATTLGRACDGNITNPNGTNDLTDADAAAGFICIQDVKKGSYSVAETSGPAGYKTDSSTPTASVTDDRSCATRKANLGGDVETFTNIPLSQIEVKFKSLADGNTTGNGITTAQISCVDSSSAAVAANSENNSADNTPPVRDDFDEVFGNGTATLLPGVYTCTVDIDP